MRKLTLAAQLLAPAVPAAAQTPDQAYADAVLARQAGDLDRAIALLEQVVRVDPNNADVCPQLGPAREFAGASDPHHSSEGVVTEVTALFGGVSWDQADSVTMRAALTYEDSEGGSQRVEFAVGLGSRS